MRARPLPQGSFAHAAYEVARKEVMQHLRTKRLLIMAVLLSLSLIFITFYVGPKIMRDGVPGSGVTARENFALLVFFSTFFVGGYFFIQLLAIVLTSDAVCSEWSNRTIFLLLSKPVSRHAFVTGKFVGSVVTVAATILVLFTLDYGLMQGFYPDAPSAAEVRGFLGALLVLMLGAAAFSSLALFFSTITKSTVMSLLATLGAWIIVFPLVSQIGFFSVVFGDSTFQGDFDEPGIDNWRYLSPGADMGVAGKLLVPEKAARQGLDFISTAPVHTSWAVMSLLVHTALWFGLSLWVVQRRNFE